MTAIATKEVHAVRAAHDARGFWRTLLAIITPIPWLAKGAQYVVDGSYFPHTADHIVHNRADHAYGFLQWFDALFVVLVVPSLVAMVLIARRGAPRLASAAAVVMGGGFLLVLPLNNSGDDDWASWAAAQNGLDPTTTGKVLENLADPRQPLAELGFLAAIVIGSILIGLALYRSRAVPMWAALAVGLGGATHIFLSFNHVVQGLGLVVLAVGCLAVSRRLLRMGNDEFDVAPETAAR